MITSAEAGRKTFEALEIEYERAYGDNPLKKACITDAMALIPRGRGGKVLDVGCGTGVPVSDMLCSSGFHITGIDISPKIIGHAQTRIQGIFQVADLLLYEPEEQYAGIFIIFSLLQLKTWTEFYNVMLRYANAVEPEGLLVLGTMPADKYVTRREDYDPSGTYVEGFPAPFMGVDEPNLLITAQGLVDFVTSMGFKILSSSVDVFQPDDPRCVPEHQQYIIARKLLDVPVTRPKPAP